MIASYSRPEDITWNLVGTGAEFLTDSAALNDGRPSSATRIQWLSGAQTTSSILYLRATWISGLANIRLCGLIGTTLPVGTKVVCRRRKDLSWDGAQEARIIQRHDGVRVVWFYFDEDEEVRDGYEFEIFNDVNGVVGIEADSAFDIGEAWGGLCSQWCIRPTYGSGREDLSVMRQSIGGQPFPVRRRALATSQIEFSPVTYTQAYGDESLDYIREQLLAYQPAVVVPITSEPFTGTPIDLDYVNQHAEFGYARSIGEIVGEAPRFVMSAQFAAPPALLPYDISMGS